MHKVSVIIPNYNHAKFLQKRIESVLNQTFTDFEVIIMDDCSTDDSREIIETYAQKDKRIKLIFNPTNSGSTFKQWNKGVRLSKGKYIWLAESDDYADRNFLEVLVKKLDAHPKAALVFSQSYMVDEYSNNLGILTEVMNNISPYFPWQRDFTLESKSVIASLFMDYNFIPNASAVLFKKSVFEQIGRADESYIQAGDWLMWLKFGLHSPICFSYPPLNFFRFHNNNVRSKTKKIQYYEYFKIMYFVYKQKHLDSTVRTKAKHKMLLYRKKCLENEKQIGLYKIYKISFIVYIIGYTDRLKSCLKNIRMNKSLL
ncbi:glycosyltransferase [Rhodocytophaga aerolata]|uniref:Glycosyltransferase n=1 Tax=Rhodocytophaga aerolata TaxID=455078 RepID=A0ABT8RJQ3_9BACT|nr:glycosyltransferase [Rhodocytophaga aerolata]MDO1451017.1 glycosyltransferase [Rhodocytophaga aerolata]